MRLNSAPKRPSIPVVLQLALVIWGSSALCYITLVNIIKNEFFQNFIPLILVGSLLAIIILAVLLWLFGARLWILFLIAILIGSFLSIICANNLYNSMKSVLQLTETECSYEVLDDQKAGTYTNNCDAKILGTNYTVKLQMPQDFEEVHAGDIIKAKAKISNPVDTQISNYWQNGICANAYVSSAEKLERKDLVGLIFQFRNHLIDTIRNFDWNKDDLPSQAEQLLNAIICGQRIDLNSGDLYDSFKCAGLAHLVAVSGAHLSLVTAILLIFLKKLKLKKWLIIFIQSIFIFLYLICAAVPISALRAAFMAYIALFSFFARRKPAPLNALGLCIIILISLDTTTSVSVSFALSAGSTIGIILFSNLFEYWITKPFPKCPEFVRGALALTFASSICSQPLSIAIFNQLPLVAPISNIICTPIFTILCSGGLLAALFASSFSTLLPVLSKTFMFFAYCISELMSWAVRMLSSIPYASIPATMNIVVAIATTFVICFFLYWLWGKHLNKTAKQFQNFSRPKIWKFALSIISGCSVTIILMFIIFPRVAGTELVMLDVGQGDAILLRSEGKSFLIDTGNQDTMLKTRLAEQGISHLDGVLITHPDDDHCGSLDVVEQLVAVGNIYIAKDLPTCNEANCQKLMSQVNKIVNDENVVKLKVGDKINFGEIELEIIWPDKYADNGGNCDSLTCVASIDVGNDGEVESRSLLCGDAEKDEIASMVSKKRIPKIDIYKCGHHGSANALYEKSTKALSPKITLISVGAKNRYGHPNSKTISMLESTGSQIYRTDQNGTITCKFVGSQIQITTDKN